MPPRQRPPVRPALLRLLAPLILFTLLGLATEYSANELDLRARSELRQETQARAGAIRAVLESELNATAFLANGVESYIVARHGQIEPGEMRAMLALIHSRGRHIRNVGVAPGNRLLYIHPLRGNEGAVGLHYPDNRVQWPAVARVIEARRGLLAGPVALVQGGEALIYRTPVFLGDAYWGLISTVIDTTSLFRTIDPLLARHDLRIALRGRDGSGESGEVFYGDPALFADATALMAISVPGGSWQMAAASPLQPSAGHPLLVRAIGWTTAAAIAALVYLLLRSLHRQRRLTARQRATLDTLRRAEASLKRHRGELATTVEARTAELRLANESLNQAKEAAEAANRAKSAFIANMSHEIRTPLHAIMGMTHILRRKEAQPDQLERLKRISSAADHLLEILDDILDISKIEAGKMEISPRRFATADLAHRIDALFADPAAHRSLDFAVDFSALPVCLEGDDTRLGQVLVNYVGNALKFTERGGIRVWAEIAGSDGATVLVRFSVADTGIGLQPEQTRRIFDAFEQGDNSTTRKYGGTGLGLAISRRLAELMGGATGVSSIPGAGSTFWFTARLGLAECRESGSPAAGV